ncbi:MAG: OPT/YSL family transporter [Candidatus Thorarchaeota archaeon]|nr:OPT/YSL family transporter [Candidatus Thorarchaeota archaeon]
MASENLALSDKNRSTRLLLAGLFSAGLFYIFFSLWQGRFPTPATIIAIIIELALLYAALFEPAPTKKRLVAGITVIVLYSVLRVVAGWSSEIVIMAAGGIAIYAFMMSEPNFPLTKRALMTGLAVGTIYTFLGIYLALKLGIVYFIGAEMLGFIVLTLHGQYTPEENTIVVAIANGSSMISVGVLITFPAIAIFQPDIAPSLITYPFIAFVTFVSAIFGMILLTPFRERFDKQPWPQAQPQAECIVSLGQEKEAKKAVLAGMGGSAIWMGSTKIVEKATGNALDSLPNALKPILPGVSTVPDWIGISNSPLIASMGFFMGWKRTLALILGSVASLLIWVFLEGMQPVTYATHLHRPEILYLALGVFAAVIGGDIMATREESMTVEEFEAVVNRQQNSGNHLLIDHPHRPSEVPEYIDDMDKQTMSLKVFRKEVGRMVRDPRGYLEAIRGELPMWLAAVSLALFTAIGIITFWFLKPFAGLSIHWLLFILGAPLVLLSAYFTARAISETGMLAGYISDIIAVPAIIFFRLSFAAVTTFMAMLGALQDSAIALLLHLKLGKLTGVKGKAILKAVFVGTILATTFGSLITYSIYSQWGFGGTNFPAPAAQLFGFLVISLRGLGNLTLPGLDRLPGIHPIFGFFYLVSFGVIGGLVGRELNKRDMSAISLAVGLLIPPATSVAMMIGGLIDYRLKKKEQVDPKDVCKSRKNRTTRILSGVVAGEAIVTILWVLWSVTSFLFV